MAPHSAASLVSIASSGSMLAMLSPQPATAQSFAGAQPSQLSRVSPQPTLSQGGLSPQVTQSIPCAVLLQTCPPSRHSTSWIEGISPRLLDCVQV